MIGVIDYNGGNLGSLLRALHHLGIEHRVVARPEDFTDVRSIMLPGVGALPAVHDALVERDLLSGLNRKVMQEGMPYLGICVGLQLLFGEAAEGGHGFGWLEGSIPRLTKAKKIPHMGWNRVVFAEDPLWQGISAENSFYFVHSYVVAPADASVILGRTEYEEIFVSAVRQKNIYGVQFHPEKSGQDGLRLLTNFVEVVARATRSSN